MSNEVSDLRGIGSVCRSANKCDLRKNSRRLVEDMKESTAETLSSPGVTRILLVEDHGVFRSGLKLLFASEPAFEVVGEADNGIDALRLAADLRVDLVLIDLTLVGRNGIEVTRDLLGLMPGIRVIGLSAKDDIAAAATLLDAGARGYVVKRSAFAELVRAIRLVANGHTYVDPSIVSPLPPAQRIGDVLVAPLSRRESQVMRLLAVGRTVKDIAEELSMSPRTLETYKARAMSKLNLKSRAELVRHAIQAGWLRDA